MTTRNLDALFQPACIALIGASNAPGSVGQVLSRNLLESGFDGPVLPVSLSAGSIRSALAYRSVDELPATPDLAVIATPPATVPDLIAQLGAKGCRAAIVITAGVDAQLRQRMLQAARPRLTRIVGPNCLGMISPARGINASFAHLTPAAGGIALVSQSGAVAAAALDWAHERGIGFSHLVTIGDAADVDVGDLLDYLALDPATKAILLYVESISDARKFMTAGRIAARTKPVVAIKAGRSAAGAKAAFSHTGALAGADLVYEAAFRRAGMLRVDGLRELFDAVATLSGGLSVSGERLAILTNGGGAGVMAADALETRGGRLATLSEATLAALDRIAPSSWSRGDPVDVLGDARPALYGEALTVLLSDREADAVLVMNCPTAVTASADAAEAVAAAVGRSKSHKPVLTCWMGGTQAAQGRRRLSAAGVPAHETPDEAVRAFMHLVDHRRNQAQLMRTPAATPDGPDDARVHGVIARARAEGREILTEVEARDVLAACGVPVAESCIAADPDAAGRCAEAIGGPVALKILSPDISHKSDVGGVALALTGAEAVRAAAEAMAAGIARAQPRARLQGFVVQPMIARPHAHELLAGVAQDAAFGPVVLFGQGGTGVEVIGDRVAGLPPLDDVLARDMIARTRIARLLAGYRDRPPVRIEAVADVLIRLARLAAEFGEIAELDINPLLADEAGVIALDARIRLSPQGAELPRTAIRPYPVELVRRLQIAGEGVTIRPIRPQDAPALTDLVARSAPEDVRLRFRSGVRTLPANWAARLSQIDYDREMALVAEGEDGAVLGVSRLAADPEGATAEFALMVRTDHQARGLGHLLLSAILDHARARGLREVWGDVGRENARMLELAGDLGFRRQAAEEASRVRVAQRLEPAPVAVHPA